MIGEGAVALSPIPQPDGQTKNRPVVVLRQMPGHGDFLVCGVSTQRSHEIPGFDEIVGIDDADFSSSGLKVASLIRLGFLAVLRDNRLLGRIGNISPERHRQLLNNLSRHLLG